MERIDDKFRRLIGEKRIAEMNAHRDSVYGMWPDYRLAYLNPAWFKFAEENGGEPQISTRWGLGASVYKCMSPALKYFFESRLQACTFRQLPWSYTYECSSDKVFRMFRQHVYPVGNGRGFLIVNDLLSEVIHEPGRKAPHPAERSYVGAAGQIYQCSNCRRTLNKSNKFNWDWVPEWVVCPHPETRYMLCPNCTEAFQPLEQ